MLRTVLVKNCICGVNCHAELCKKSEHKFPMRATINMANQKSHSKCDNLINSQNETTTCLNRTNSMFY